MKAVIRRSLRSLGSQEKLRKPLARVRGFAKRFVELTTPEGGGDRPWDTQFRRWIAEAETQGLDPNDVGDKYWSSPASSLERNYYPLFDSSSVVLELGPGSGRYTRHLIKRCREMVLVDYSQAVCEWCRTYFAGENMRIIHCTDYGLDEIADASIDAVVANGVFEHIYPEGTFQYLRSFARVLRPGGRGCFNFDNINSKEGWEKFVKELPRRLDDRMIFRFYHPDVIAKLIQEAGLELEKMDTSDSRMAFATFRRPS